jgi:SAM-dependent methyltransferase
MPSRLRLFIRQFFPSGTGRMMRAVQARLAGYRHECPVCGERVRQFIPFNVYMAHLVDDLNRHQFDLEPRDAETLNLGAYSCHLCGASDRDRLYALYITRQANEGSRSRRPRLLDIAPSPPLRNVFRRLDRFEIRTADLFMPDVDDKVDLMDMNIYADNSFDCFICSHVLEHVPDDRKAMRELYRVLRPGGWGIAMAPIYLSLKETREDSSITDPAERIHRFGQDDHLRLYASEDFRNRLKEAGFKLQCLGVKDFSKEEFDTYGISERSVLYICGK